MAILRNKEIKNMTKEEREDKIKELKMELVKARVSAGKGSKNKMSEIKKTLARLLMLNE